MRYFPQILLSAPTGLLLLNTAGTTFKDNAVAPAPTVAGLEAEVVAQGSVVAQTRPQARRTKELLRARESPLAAAKHGIRAAEALK